jgi:predicted RecB family nuclease
MSRAINSISNEIFDAFLTCSYKSFLLTSGLKGEKSDYIELISRLDNKYRVTASNRLAITAEQGLAANIPKCQFEELRAADEIFFNVCVTVEGLNSQIDAVKRVEGVSQLGPFHYIPVIFCRNVRIRKNQKLWLAYRALVLGQAQGRIPDHGGIIYGPKLKKSRIRLTSHVETITRYIDSLSQQNDGKVKAALFLNRNCSTCQFKKHCRKEAEEADHISLLSGISEKEVTRYNNKGIFTVNQLSFTYRPRRRKKRKGKNQRFEYALKALALREQRAYIKELPQISPSETEIYLDFEGLPDERFIYQIGMVIKEKNLEKTHTFWADNKDREEKIFKQFLKVLSRFKDYKIYHYGSYEISNLKRVGRKIDSINKDKIESVIKNSQNLLSIFTTNIYTPTYTNGLKDIANFLGFKWTAKHPSGIQSIVWRKSWELERIKKLKDKIILYNIEDCRALMVVKDWIEKIKVQFECPNNEELRKVSDIVPESKYQAEYCIFKSSIKDLEIINKCAYFDYQRTKVYLRTNKAVAKALKKEGRNKRTSGRVNKIIDVPLLKHCYHCNSDKLHQHTKFEHKSMDLKISKNGLRRQLRLYRGKRSLCTECNRALKPKDGKNIPKYGPDLINWSMNLFVNHKVNLNTVSKILLESFDINIPRNSLDYYKLCISTRYDTTLSEIKGLIVSGPLIHVDETPVKVDGFSSPYVWVFTNMNTVFYLFRENREADFLKELLKNFGGILVSDFYPGYDSLSCYQQKCLIHLIRDLNDDLFTNQFNEEYKMLVQKFSDLMMGIVNTIDNMGLRKRYLKKYKKDVDRFYKKMIYKNGETELTIKWQKRFKKNEGKLFTFLDHDDCPWNNNNAEHAIIPFAKYRTYRDSHFTKRSITEYLTLLSIQQTCKYRGVKFLDFLRSGTEIIEDFCK